MHRMELLRDARAGAGLSQRELAQRAGTSQAMVARIERGRQSPSLATLERLVRACGLELRVEAAGEPRVPAELAAVAADSRLLVWRAGRVAYAFPLGAVERIAELPPLHRLPGQAPGAGVVMVDGAAVAALDAASRLGIADAAPDQIVVVTTAAGRRAVIVDRAETLAGETTVVPPPAGSGAAPFVTGLAEVEGEQVIVLDPDGLCTV
jgi:transcriptional regulator with XRE-family HTH domain